MTDGQRQMNDPFVSAALPRLALQVCLALLVVPRALAAGTQTIATTYQYNADGAPTAVTTRVDAGAPATTYLTWDNFTPDAAAPTSGTVRAGDGNLLGVGSGPVARQFTYDVRDRLTGCAAADQSVAYAYHPASLMKSSTLASDDALQFYYDNAGAPRMVNTAQPSTGMTASFLGPVRYLSDGREQILFTPRKDVAGLYDAAAQSLAPYHYDPYGASTGAAPLTPARQHVSTSALGPSQYDLSANPFQYAGEYRDPTCDAYYLRARWYLPAQQSFLSRDPADQVHRYGYTAGNPVGRRDPSGFKYTGAGFSREMNAVAHRLTPGAWAWAGPALPVFGQALGGIELLGLLPSFFHHPTTQGYVTFGFLSASIAAEAALELPQIDRTAPFLLHSGRAFATRLGSDVGLGGLQTFAQSYRHGRLDVPALARGIETTTAGIFWARVVGGIGYRPYNMTAADVDAVVNARHGDDLLVFRVREDRTGDNTVPGRFLGHYANRPILDWARLGLFHESVAAFAPGSWLQNELWPEETYDDIHETADVFHFAAGTTGGGNAAGGFLTRGTAPAFQFVGRLAAGRAGELLDANPLRFGVANQLEEENDDDFRPIPNQSRAAAPPEGMFNNSHRHVAAVLRQFNF